MSQVPRVLDAVCVCALPARRSASQGASERASEMAKKRAKKKDGGAAAMEVSATIASPSRPPSPDDAMDTTDVVPTGAELDLLVSKKKRKKKASTSVSKSLQIQGMTKKGPQKRKAAKLRKEKSIERALLNMDKQHEKVQRSEFKTERVQSLKNLY